MITLQHITVRFGDRRILDDISAEVVPARITAVMGPNGAGKSTTILRTVET